VKTILGDTTESAESRSELAEISSPSPPLTGRTLAAIGAAAFAAEIPFFFLGTPSGHDFEFHLYSWLEVLAQWKQGILYPRWAALAHFGYGEPRFVFYPPASWELGALLSAIFPWKIASSIYIWIALVLAGISMFALARRWLNRRDATFAAVLYAVNPYHLVIVYWRSAFAELLASCLVPLLLLLLLRVADGERRVVVSLSLLLAAAWLTNAPAAVMIHYSLALLLVCFAWQRRSPRLLATGAAAVGLGACLSAFYLLPAVYEQRWVNIAEAVSAGSTPADNFLFIHTADADHDAFNRIISWIAMLEIMLTLATAWAAGKSRALRPRLWSVLCAWGVVCSLLLFSMTRVLWQLLPKLEFMQFPWRWLLCLSVVLSIFVTVGARHWWMRMAICLVALSTIGALWTRIQAPWWDTAADLKEMRDNVLDGIGYEGTDEYTPVGADPTAIDKGAAKVRVDGAAESAIHISGWDAESKSFTAQMSAPGQLVVRLFSDPAWKVEVNGRAIETAQLEGTGQMLIPVEAGMNHVQITFTRTWDRIVGGWISFSVAICVLVWVWMARHRERSTTQDTKVHKGI